MSVQEEKAAKKLEEIGVDFDLNVESVGRYLSSISSSPSITFLRLRMIVESAESELKNKKPHSKKGSVQDRAQNLVAQATEGDGRRLTTLLKNHGFEEEKCELCEWISSNDYGNWLSPDEWIFEALLRNENSSDSILSKLMDTFESAPGAWGIASELEYHPNASTKTISRAKKYSTGPEWD